MGSLEVTPAGKVAEGDVKPEVRVRYTAHLDTEHKIAWESLVPLGASNDELGWHAISEGVFRHGVVTDGAAYPASRIKYITWEVLET